MVARHRRTIVGAWVGRHIAPPRFTGFIAMLAIAGLGWHAAFPAHGWQDCLTVGFDLAAALTLGTMIPLLRETGLERMRRRAAHDDANARLTLLLSVVLALVVTAAITVELKGARSGDAVAIAKLVATLLLVWLFANSVFTLHYAHAYYAPATPPVDAAEHAGKRDHPWTGGLDFPKTPEPEYSDFAYFAFTLGMTFQTSDTAVSAPALRRVVVLHSFFAFLFNIGIIAFSINALGGIGG